MEIAQILKIGSLVAFEGSNEQILIIGISASLYVHEAICLDVLVQYENDICGFSTTKSKYWAYWDGFSIFIQESDLCIFNGWPSGREWQFQDSFQFKTLNKSKWRLKFLKVIKIFPLHSWLNCQFKGHDVSINFRNFLVDSIAEDTKLFLLRFNSLYRLISRRIDILAMFEKQSQLGKIFSYSQRELAADLEAIHEEFQHFKLKDSKSVDEQFNLSDMTEELNSYSRILFPNLSGLRLSGFNQWKEITEKLPLEVLQKSFWNSGLETRLPSEYYLSFWQSRLKSGRLGNDRYWATLIQYLPNGSSGPLLDLGTELGFNIAVVRPEY